MVFGRRTTSSMLQGLEFGSMKAFRVISFGATTAECNFSFRFFQWTSGQPTIIRTKTSGETFLMCWWKEKKITGEPDTSKFPHSSVSFESSLRKVVKKKPKKSRKMWGQISVRTVNTVWWISILIDRKHLVKLCMIFAVFASQCDAIKFECVFSVEDWVIVDKIYGCTVKAYKDKEVELTSTSFSGSHLKGKTGKDVEALNIENGTLATLPKNIDKTFPNLKALRVAKASLKSISSDDLKVFPALKVLCLWANELKTLDGNLLINNVNLEFVNFGSNQIQHVGPNFFAPTTKLIAAYFEENTCINSTNPFAIEDLKFELAVKCPPSFDMVEVALIYGGKLATKNDDIDNKIKLLENRIAELEQQAKK